MTRTKCLDCIIGQYRPIYVLHLRANLSILDCFIHVALSAYNWSIRCTLISLISPALHFQPTYRCQQWLVRSTFMDHG